MENKLNNQLRVFFHRKIDKKYMPIGVYQLSNLIGEHNANKAILNALNSKTDKYSKKFRKSGTAIFYKK